MNKVGFIGLGIMGKPMAKNLLRAGVPLLVNDISEKNQNELVEAGAVAADYSTIGSECDFVFTMLPAGSYVKDVLFGKGGVAESMKSGTVVCDMSSVTPDDSKFCYEALKQKGIRFIDSPVSGGEPKAIDGTLAFMAGGDEDTFEKLQPYFEIMGASSILVGPPGSGSVTKLANQIIVNLTIAAVSEAFVLAEKAGADPEKVFNAIKGGLAGSQVLNDKIPKILDRDFAPGGKISINRKDIKNVLDTAASIDVPVPMSAQLYQIMQALKVGGHMDDDHGGIIQYFEQLAGVEVKRK